MTDNGDPLPPPYELVDNQQTWLAFSDLVFIDPVAMSQNENLHVLVASGYYDLATPFFATEYTFSHLGGDPSLLTRVTQTYYESGHMMYIHRPSLEKLTAAVREFMHRALERTPGEMAADNGV